MFRFDNKMITVASSMILAVVLVAMIGMSMPAGDSGGGPVAKVGDSGGGTNPAGADPAIAVEPERSTSVPVKHLTEKEFCEGIVNRKSGVLYLYEYKDNNDPTYSMPVGLIILDKNKLSGLEFNFEGEHFSNFKTEIREHEVIVTADVEECAGVSVMWDFGLLSSNKKENVGLGTVCDEDNVNIRFIRNEWEKGKFVGIGLRRPESN